MYEGLQYKLLLEFPGGYPYQAVSVKFSTPCYHPNVDNHGNICLDILKEKWSALYDVRTVLLSIQSLLAGKTGVDYTQWFPKCLTNGVAILFGVIRIWLFCTLSQCQPARFNGLFPCLQFFCLSVCDLYAHQMSD